MRATHEILAHKVQTAFLHDMRRCTGIAKVLIGSISIDACWEYHKEESEELQLLDLTPKSHRLFYPEGASS